MGILTHQIVCIKPAISEFVGKLFDKLDIIFKITTTMKKENQNFLYFLAIYTQLGLVIFATILISLLIGVWLDRHLGTRVFTFVFIILGVLGAGYNAYRLTRGRNDKSRGA